MDKFQIGDLVKFFHNGSLIYEVIEVSDDSNMKSLGLKVVEDPCGGRDVGKTYARFTHELYELVKQKV